MTSPYGDDRPRVVRTSHFAQWKSQAQKWTMLTSYDTLTARLFEEAGIPALLVGDSVANNVLGYDNTLAVTVDEMLVFTKAVSRSVERPLVIGDLPFGSYQQSPQQALETAVRFMKEGGAAAVKLEGGEVMAPTIEKLTSAGVPVVAHVGYTPQHEHALGGHKVQGRGEDGANAVMRDAQAVADAGAFAVVLEMVPTETARIITETVEIPTVGIGAGPHVDAQVLVWQDMVGLRGGRMPRFVKQYASVRTDIAAAVENWMSDVSHGRFPDAAHSFLD